MELDITCSGGCSNPRCTVKHERLEEMYLHGRCHPHAGVQARYVPKEGCLYVECLKCELPILKVEVK